MYNKLFTKILDSSIWLQSDSTRLVWITLLAAMDEDGFVQIATVGNLAARARVTLEACREAVLVLEAPEPESAHEGDDGRRIEKVPGGWMVIKAKEYQGFATREHQRNKTRERVRRFRERNAKALQTPECNAPVTPSDTDTDTYTDTESGSSSSAVEAKDSGNASGSAEPRKGPRSAPEPKPERKLAGTVPLNTGDDYPIYADDLEQWQKTYPAVDVRQELKEFKQWCIDNPTRRKTKAGIRRAINTWLSREQDRGGTNGNGDHRSGARQSVLGDNKRELAKTLQRIGERGGNGSAPDPAGDVLRAALPEPGTGALPGVSSGTDGGAGDRGAEPGNARRVEVLPPAGTAAGTGGRRNRELPF